ncbi:MAG TPA: GvpL/GvpF family gas vesicle protein [Trebonia sp.]|nr:GvpL/GvpF family gas vesicle protein [Trebonia sp.]
MSGTVLPDTGIAGHGASELGVWAYAITDSGHVPEAADAAAAGAGALSRLAGVGGARVRAAACAGLAMLVSDVSLTEFGEAALRRNLEDLDWLDEVARAHHHVISAAAELFPVLPTRLATVYSGDAAVCAALADRRDQLRDALRRIGGRVEWGVKAYEAPEPEPSAETAAPDRAAPDEAAGTRGGAGLAYLKRRREQLAAKRESQAGAVNGAREVHAELSGRAEDARLHPPQAASLSGVRLPMLLNAAYLLGPGDGTDFTAAVAAAGTAHPELRIELTGPWPPYSFAGDEGDG